MQAKVNINDDFAKVELELCKEGPLSPLYVGDDKVEHVEHATTDEDDVVLRTQSGRVVRVPYDTFYEIKGMTATWNPKMPQPITYFN
jgi:hypothetical protein